MSTDPVADDPAASDFTITADDVRAFMEGLREAPPLDSEDIRQVQEIIASISPEEMAEIRGTFEALGTVIRRLAEEKQ